MICAIEMENRPAVFRKYIRHNVPVLEIITLRTSNHFLGLQHLLIHI